MQPFAWWQFQMQCWPVLAALLTVYIGYKKFVGRAAHPMDNETRTFWSQMGVGCGGILLICAIALIFYVAIFVVGPLVQSLTGGGG